MSCPFSCSGKMLEEEFVLLPTCNYDTPITYFINNPVVISDFKENHVEKFTVMAAVVSEHL